ncbi:HNH endonuclease [Mycobacterium koreense]|uniref:Restriction endonuclease n=1 Tax=Mycolicibacillus koreensis TaxID=1069220 RepID=A0A7I7SB12_9MYCO|nr:HNH endonuclease [Mycolicibacillus koreensis]MCV7247610.1 HNH endonuclease [Mycolicibacillus koreensis]OSC32814.1 restriction endonuclease [Mycolicibacillus koreensis]BBY53988.1 HNH endonuclease [Mycolicibacillus koreensis]
MTATIPISVEVFNADYRAFATVGWMDAVRLMLRDAVHVIETHTPAVHVHSPSVVIELPASVVLKRYAHRPYRPVQVERATREGVLVRDKHTCAYCGGRANTIDHVLPRSKGGGDGWLNLVAACEACNGRKGDAAPQERGMRLLWEPYVPREKDRFALMC